ncbi:MAG: protein-L-isoaspartate(D-aspartate) O-methyltransferase [Betaproteobacteria bacterium]|nr:protein-L-isoaspartate(D-aspartate) O-methyltransferase [Betaproteobacteria bacterium]
MLEDIAAMAGATAAETGRAAISANVMAAMSRVPRPRFVSPPLAASAWDNRPLPIGEGQTISQPFIVALMTDLLELRAGDSVLEFGTGSGYQAALLAELVANVYTIEIVAPLGRKAAATLAALGYRNINTRIGDGYAGWREYAPYDAIMVTAAAPEVPAALIEQLRPGGRLVIPVSGSAEVQALLLLHKQADGRTLSRRVLPVRFVPLVRGAPAK